MADVRLGDHRQIEASLVTAERSVAEVTDDAVRRWVRDVERLAEDLLSEQRALVAAAQLPEQAEMERLWSEAVSTLMLPSVSSAYNDGAVATVVTSADLLSDRAIDAARTAYLDTAGDRLVRGLDPPLPANAWETLRTAIDEEVRRGASTAEISRRISAEMSWDVDTVFWERRKAEIAGQIDAILDPISTNPRDPARVAARLNDPDIAALQRQNAYATQQLDREQSWWRTRADRIARTESHGAHEAGSFDAMQRVGVETREWITAADDRVRPTHVEADGQRVAIDEPFNVGGELLMYPGDPAGSAGETINCRCVSVGADPGDLELFPELLEET